MSVLPLCAPSSGALLACAASANIQKLTCAKMLLLYTLAKPNKFAKVIFVQQFTLPSSREKG